MIATLLKPASLVVTLWGVVVYTFGVDGLLPHDQRSGAIAIVIGLVGVTIAAFSGRRQSGPPTSLTTTKLTHVLKLVNFVLVSAATLWASIYGVGVVFEYMVGEFSLPPADATVHVYWLRFAFNYFWLVAIGLWIVCLRQFAITARVHLRTGLAQIPEQRIFLLLGYLYFLLYIPCTATSVALPSITSQNIDYKGVRLSGHVFHLSEWRAGTAGSIGFYTIWKCDAFGFLCRSRNFTLASYGLARTDSTNVHLEADVQAQAVTVVVDGQALFNEGL